MGGVSSGESTPSLFATPGRAATRLGRQREASTGKDTLQSERQAKMLHVALWEPEIPPNTGNIARLCAATKTALHLIGRLGFRLDDRELRRAGLDYWPEVELYRHPTFVEFETAVGVDRIVCIETGAERRFTDAAFGDGDCLLFGNESHGLPASIRERFAKRTFGIPMLNGAVRSLNLASAAGIVLFEALRQLHGW
jgi:tRNA (cytidine/uridine-2'-O-)-methyltransferase